MAVVSSFLYVLALLGLSIGVAALIRPFRRIGLGTRSRAGLLIFCAAALFIGAIATAAMDPALRLQSSESRTTMTEVVAAKNASPSSTPETVSRSREEIEQIETLRMQARMIRTMIADGESLIPGLPNPPLSICDEADPVCPQGIVSFASDWGKAHNGSYDAQRNVAYCLSRGCTGIMPNRIQGCAWRMVIIEAAAPEVGEGDTGNLEVECGQLAPAEREAAANQAVRIASLVQSRAT